LFNYKKQRYGIILRKSFIFFSAKIFDALAIIQYLYIVQYIFTFYPPAMLTTELRNRFDSLFHKLMANTPPELRKKWDGKIEWHDSKLYPTIQTAILQDMPPNTKAAYVTLLNKLSRGAL
jgi:hypothetical protein